MAAILVVDDDQRFGTLCMRALARGGHFVMTAENAERAHEIMKRIPVQVVILDIRMTEVNGDEFFEVIKLFHRNAIVIVASAYPVDEQRRQIPNAYRYHDKADGIYALVRKINDACTYAYNAV